MEGLSSPWTEAAPWGAEIAAVCGELGPPPRQAAAGSDRGSSVGDKGMLQD